MRLLAVFALLLPMSVFAETVLKISTLYPPGSDAVKSLNALGDQLRVDTGGEVSLKVYPGGVMGDDATVMRKIRVGQLHGALVSGVTLDNLSEDLRDLSDPFQFDRLEQVYSLREQLDSEFRDRLLDVGWYGFGPLDGGFSFLMSKRPVVSMADIRQSKLWLPNTPDVQQMARMMDVDYLVMNVGDVLTGLDTGAIDTLIAPPAAALTLNWHSRFNYYADTPVMYTWGMLILPERVMNRLSEEHRGIVVQAMTDWAETLEGSLRSGNEGATAAIDQLLEKRPFNQNDLQVLRENTQVR